MIVDFIDRARVIAHETGHAVAAWASPFIPAPEAIRLYPSLQEAETLVEPIPEVTSSLDALECAVFALGGAAGEAFALGDFERLVPKDLDYACWAAQVVRQMGIRLRRRRTTPFMRRLPPVIWRELHVFIDHAYDLALKRIEAHAEAYGRLRDLLTRDYLQGKLAWDAAELAGCLGPRKGAADGQ